MASRRRLSAACRPFVACMHGGHAGREGREGRQARQALRRRAAGDASCGEGPSAGAGRHRPSVLLVSIARAPVQDRWARVRWPPRGERAESAGCSRRRSRRPGAARACIRASARSSARTRARTGTHPGNAALPGGRQGSRARLFFSPAGGYIPAAPRHHRSRGECSPPLPTKRHSFRIPVSCEPWCLKANPWPPAWTGADALQPGRFLLY